MPALPPFNRMKPSAATAFHTLVQAVLLLVLVGWLLKVGQSILLPVFAAVIAMYVLITSAQAMTRLPVVGRWPQWLRRLLVLLLFMAVMAVLAAVVAMTVEQVIDTLPRYEQNLQRLAASAASFLGLERLPDWAALKAATLGQWDMRGWVIGMLASAGSLAGMVFLVVVYALFLMGERAGFARKLSVALPGESAAQTQAMIRDINQRIGQYLSAKTLVNAILAAASFAVLWAFGVDFALFWALMIGLLHYIPYIGSAVGVAAPVLLSLAQFGSLTTTMAMAALLFALQGWIGNVVEPRIMGKQVNLSPFVVMLALSIWSALWGVAGAILAIPLTAMLAIVLNAFASTRPLTILLANDVSSYETPTS